MTIKEVKIQLALGTLSNEMRRQLARNKRTSKKVLTMLSTDEDGWIRCYVAANPNTPKEVLTKLGIDKDHTIR